MLNPGGVVVGQIPNPYFVIESHSRLPFMGWLPTTWQRRYWKLAPVSWEHDFYVVTMKHLKPVAQRTGFEVVRVRNFNYPSEAIPQQVRWAARLMERRPLRYMPWSWQFVCAGRTEQTSAGGLRRPERLLPRLCLRCPACHGLTRSARTKDGGMVSVRAVEATELFAGPSDAPLQIVSVGYQDAAAPTRIRVEGDGLTGVADIEPGEGTVEIPVTVTDPRPGRRRAATIVAEGRRTDFTFTDAEPGWTMFMVSHFHYDPVWWNTQAAYTSEWTEDPPGRARQTNGFELVAAHLEMARRDPDYKFVLAEVDYLKPYWDTHPQDRADLRRFVAGGRVEIMGGSYNEPNTNLTSPETAIRNFVHGIGFQRHVMGADPATAWQLDVFGHDPQFPGMAAAAGLTSSSWARGPHHQWGPMAGGGDAERMQFASEFEWIAPSGTGLLTHYMPAHYSAGWWMDSAATLAEAQDATWELFAGLKKVTSTRNVLLPVGTDYTPPNKWVTEIHRDWNSRYTWPRFVCALPREFFAAVRAELAERGVEPSPQTRDMNPIYTGKDVSFIDTKQANRAAETAVLDAERFAAFAHLLTGATYPEPALAKAWVQLAYGAHHDGITGSESDQVYLDLLTGWREAWDIGCAARDNALALLGRTVAPAPLTVWNPLAHNRTDVVTAEYDGPPPRVVDDTGAEVPAVVDRGRVTFVAGDVPSLGRRSYRLEPGGPGRWEPVPGTEIANAHHRVRVDPARGGAVDSLRHHDRELMTPGRVGNELALYAEYPSHPQAGEGPWHLLPRGPVVGSADGTAEVQAYRCPVGERLVVTGHLEGLGGLLRYTQTLTLWAGIDRLDCTTIIDDFVGEDQLLRLRWPVHIAGAMPVSEVGDAVIGRGFALIHEPGSARSVDTAAHPWTLENPAFGWFGLSSAARITFGDSGVHAISVAEVITPSETVSGPLARALMVALVRAGVTATCSGADRPRYGHLAVDSNLPDTRIALGGPECNAFTAALLTDAGPEYAAELNRQLENDGHARLFVPAAAPLAAAWVPDADLRGIRALPVLVVAGRGSRSRTDDEALRDAVAAVTADLGDAEIGIAQRVAVPTGRFEARTVALLNRGVPSFAVESDGTLHTALLRSCTGWPSGVWTTHERRPAPDGSNFQLQHWSHSFDYAVVAGDGDWRDARIPLRSNEFSRPLLTAGFTGCPPDVGELPERAALLRIDGADVRLEALKLCGNPTPEGRSQTPAGRAVLRLVETHGRDAEVRLASDAGSIRSVGRTGLLEDFVPAARHARDLTLHGFEICTVPVDFTPARKPEPGHGPASIAPDAESAQPLYARYWLHNRGPAPLGGLPAVAHLHPHRLTAEASAGQVSLRLTVASDCTDARLSGAIDLVCPAGCTATPAWLPVDLEAGAHLEADVTVTLPAGAAPGRYPVRAQLRLTGDELPAAWRQTVEDVCVITVDGADGPLLRLLEGPSDVVLRAGERGRVSVMVATDCHADLAVEGHVISPWGTWEWIGPAAVGAVLPAAGQVRLEFDVVPPASTAPGDWWALVRVAAAGDLLYTPAVRVVVR